MDDGTAVWGSTTRAKAPTVAPTPAPGWKENKMGNSMLLYNMRFKLIYLFFNTQKKTRMVSAVGMVTQGSSQLVQFPVIGMNRLIASHRLCGMMTPKRLPVC